MPPDAVLVSDVHVDGPTCSRQAAFLRFLAGLDSAAPPRLVLLGDIFHVWWCHADQPFVQFAPVLAALADFPLVCLAGNHDFHAPRYFGAKGAVIADHPAAIGSRISVQLGELHTMLTHGDEVDTSLGYRGLHAVIRSPAFDFALGAAGPETGWRFLHRLAGHAKGAPWPDAIAKQHALAATLVSVPPEPGSPLSTRTAPGAAGDVHELVAMGHTHAPEIREHPGFTFLNTGDWVEHRTYATVTGSVVELHRFDG